MFEYKVLVDHDKRFSGNFDGDALKAVSDRVDRPELVVSASCQASSDRMRRRRNIIPSPGPSSDRRPMRGLNLTASIVVMTSPLFSCSQSPAITSVVSASRSACGARSRAPISWPRAPWKRGPLQKESHMLTSDFLRGLSVRLVSAILLLARHAAHFQDFPPNI